LAETQDDKSNRVSPRCLHSARPIV
jgi:hypothetical protein